MLNTNKPEKKLLTPGAVKGPVTEADVDKLYDNLLNDDLAGPLTPAMMRELQAEGAKFPTLDDLAEAIKEKRRGKKAKDDKAKEDLLNYLQHPNNPLFTPQTNKDKNITPNDADALFAIEKSGPGTLALVHDLEELKPHTFNNIPELLAAGKAHDAKKKKNYANI